MRVLITGGQGFIGKNLVSFLKEYEEISISLFSREESNKNLINLVSQVDAVIHLAGENRPKRDSAFRTVNVGLTKVICDAIKISGRKIQLIYASSTQAELDNPYGRSKREAEMLVEQLAFEAGCPSVIYRFPGVFGKWCKPNYNSVVATFCYNTANDLSLQINDASKSIQLNYIDDVVNEIFRVLQEKPIGLSRLSVEPEYSIKIGDLASQIKSFKDSRSNLKIDRVGSGLIRALYSTYVSYLPKTNFSYDLKEYSDYRGKFVEILKTIDSGQFSFFTAHPGITRGDHYHHTKTEKFLVIKGSACFSFRNILTNEVYELLASEEKPKVVETIPGWAHNITNVGKSEMVVILWANEIFDNESPDTITCEV